MASRERDDAMAGLLKRTLAGDAGAGNDCPPPDILAAYFERSLEADETGRLELHFSQCGHCRDQLAALVRAEAEAPAQVASSKIALRAPRASWLFDWRWLAPVAAVLILTAVWATRRPTLRQITNHAAETPASVASSALAPAVPSAATLPVPPKTSARDETKKQVLSRMAPAPASPKIPPVKESVAVNSISNDKSAQVEHSPLQNLQSPRSIRDLPLAGRNYAQLDSLSKSAPAAGPPADQAANAAPRATNESVTVEAQVGTIATTQATPPPAPAPSRAENGAVGGAITSGTTNAKQEPAAMNAQFSEVVTAEQSLRERQVASTLVRTPDPNVLWRIEHGGSVERSVDGGATWHGTLPRQNGHYTAGSAPSADVCWLAGNDGIILLTLDGSHWQTIPPPVQANLVAVTARDASNASVTTFDGRKFVTANQGESWTPEK
ncbi:MAG TPA: hypothetical protein VMB02_07370 [Candidatus Aquilonibacter sp.]|nr:hypothetical protein [Candidatus Aquilonibacter sp.]